MNKIIFTMIALVSFPLFAYEEIDCNAGKYNDEGVDRLSVTQTITTKTLVLTGIKINRTHETRTFPYWPNFHRLGIDRLKLAYKEYGCEMRPELVKCEIVEPYDDCDRTLKLINVSNGEVFYSISPVKDKTMEQVRDDFVSIGFCH